VELYDSMAIHVSEMMLVDARVQPGVLQLSRHSRLKDFVLVFGISTYFLKILGTEQMFGFPTLQLSSSCTAYVAYSSEIG
jgi:hypothetical protein